MWMRPLNLFEPACMDKELLRIERARIEWSGSNWQGRANQLPQSNEAQETDGVLWEL